jgi:hypothetical protein
LWGRTPPVRDRGVRPHKNPFQVIRKRKKEGGVFLAYPYVFVGKLYDIQYYPN